MYQSARYCPQENGGSNSHDILAKEIGSKKIEFRNVSFAYASHLPLVLEQVTFTIPSGFKVRQSEEDFILSL